MLNILFEDNYLLVLNKPAGLPVERDRWGHPSMEQQVTDYFREAYPWKKQLLTGVAHRLDKPVSGVLIFAKTPMALKALGRQFEERTVQKIYRTLVEKQPPQSAGELVHWLRKDAKNHRTEVSRVGEAGAQECQLRYHVLQSNAAHSLLEVELLTGRYHQIRAQLAAIGVPIVGDEKYGAAGVGTSAGIHLHAYRLTVRHPKTGEEMTFTAPLPVNNRWNMLPNG